MLGGFFYPERLSPFFQGKKIGSVKFQDEPDTQIVPGAVDDMFVPLGPLKRAEKAGTPVVNLLSGPILDFVKTTLRTLANIPTKLKADDSVIVIQRPPFFLEEHVLILKEKGGNKELIIGSGCSAEIRVGVSLKTGELFAIKHFFKLRTNADRDWKKECDSLQKMGILIAAGHYLSSSLYKQYWAMMPLYSGKDLEVLSSKIRSEFSLSEKISILTGLLREIEAFYNKTREIHIDIKPENFILTMENTLKHPTIHLIDLAFTSALFKTINEEHGALLYRAPECYKEDSYCIENMIYSIGLIAAEIFTEYGSKKNQKFIEDTYCKDTYCYAISKKYTVPNIINDVMKSLLNLLSLENYSVVEHILAELIRSMCDLKKENRPNFDQIFCVIAICEKGISLGLSEQKANSESILNNFVSTATEKAKPYLENSITFSHWFLPLMDRISEKAKDLAAIKHAPDAQNTTKAAFKCATRASFYQFENFLQNKKRGDTPPVIKKIHQRRASTGQRYNLK